ncbi:MAG: histidine kinase [Lewinellaceae bacterium]|nr:histidine kinase [Phaeodactylibacter sp.]MCB9038624.1 histidine kinase [Lewinellaceae bacterium]
MNRRILLHLGFWLAYALYDGYLSVPLSGTTFAELAIWERLSMGYRAELLLLLIKIPAVYLLLYRFLPPSFENKKFVRLGFQFLLTAAVATAAIFATWHEVIYPHIYHIAPPAAAANAWIAVFRLLWSSFDILMLLGVASALKLFRMRLGMAEREKQLVEEKLQSELRFLRAQTNPHFLFNTLNNLYHLARKRSDNTPDAILKLSGMMRFMLYECTSPRIRLSQEVNVIRDYLDLERLRYGDRLEAGFQVDADDDGQFIAPLLLLPFVENAFKHGASESRGNTWVRIFLLLKNGALSFQVENAKDPSEGMAAEGIGLKNVKRQLELLYPGYGLELEDRGGQFFARLQIDLSNEPEQP